MYQVAIKDPVYGLSVWQAEVFGATSFPEAVQQADAIIALWQSLSAQKRANQLRNWQQRCQIHVKEIVKVGSQTTGLSMQQLQEDIEAWSQISAEPKETAAGIVVLMTDIADLAWVHSLLNYLAAGQTAIVMVPSFLAALVQQLFGQWPDAASKALLQMVVVDGWSDLSLPVEQIAQVDYQGSIAGAKAVHQQLAGHFELPVQFMVQQYHTVALASEADLNQLPELVKRVFHHSGQSLNNVKRIVISRAIEPQAKRALQQAVKQLRVAAFDAKPAPFLSSLPTLEHAKQAVAYYRALLAQGATDIIPMRRLMSHSGMLTPGVIQVAAEQIKHMPPIVPAPLLQIIFQ